MLLHALMLIALTGAGAFVGSVAARLRSLKVQDVKRLHLEPGDKVVLRLATGFDSAAAIEGIEEQLRAIFPENRVIVFTDDHEFSVVRRPDGLSATVMKRGGMCVRVKGDAPTSPPPKPSDSKRSTRPAPPTNPGVSTR